MTTTPDPTAHEPVMLEHALDYARHGLHVIPIGPGQKHPPLPAWQKAATVDPATITAWWTGLYRSHGIGIATGHNGLFVVDLDMHGTTNGLQTWLDLCDTHPDLADLDTFTVTTGNEGLHLYFYAPPGIEIRNDAGRRLGPGIDIRGIGGQVLAPPTVHPNGNPYRINRNKLEHIVRLAADHTLIRLLTTVERTPERAPHAPVAPLSAPVTPGDETPAEHFNRTTTWADLLERDGWTLRRTDTSGEQHWTRPGKDRRDGTSATVGYRGTDALVVFTTSIPGLTPDKAYSRFGYEAAMRHHGDRSELARTIRRTMPTVDRAVYDLTVTGAPSAPSTPNAPGAPGAPQVVAGTDWERLDATTIATQILNGTLKPETPDIGHIPNAPALIYRNRINQIFGESGGGKTWIALHLIAETLRNDEHVLLVDYEDSLLGTVNRLLALGITIPQLARLDYRNPETSIGLAWEHLDRTHPYSLIVLDSTGESLAAGGVDDVDSEIARWFALVRQTLDLPGEPAILLIDHVAKSKEANPLYAIGSQRKRAAVTGAAYRVDTVIPFAQGKNGIVKLTVAKDRLGTRPRAAVACEAHITSRDGQVTIDLQLSEAAQAAAEGKDFRPTTLMERVSIYIEENPGCTWSSINTKVTGKEEGLRNAVRILDAEGYIKVGNGPRDARLHTSIRPYRRDDLTI